MHGYGGGDNHVVGAAAGFSTAGAQVPYAFSRELGEPIFEFRFSNFDYAGCEYGFDASAEAGL
jgi:hypothetical protein